MRYAPYRDATAFIWAYWRRRPLMVALLLAGMAAATACDVLVPLAAGRLVDAVAAADRDPARAIDALVLLVALAAGFQLFINGSFQLWVRLAPAVMRQIVGDAFARVQRFSADWHANSFAGATVRKITRGMWAYDLYADTVYVGILPAVLVIGGLIAVLFWQWPLMGLVVLLAAALYVAAVAVLTRRYVGPANVALKDADSRLGGALADAVTCNPTVKAFGAEAREVRRLGDATERWRARAVEAWRREINVNVVGAVLSVLLLTAMLALALWFWTRGRASPGDVTFVISSHFLIHGQLRQVGRYIRDLQQAVNEIEDVLLFQRQDLGVADQADAVPFRPGAGAIRFERVGFGYGDGGAPLYDGFDLEIAPAERVALVGPSGSGKSTFVKLVQRLYDVDAGRVLVDGQDVRGVTQASLRRAIALVPQDPILFHRSLAENIAYAKPDAGRGEIERAARLAHADGFIRELPDGYGTLVGERGVKLSGGERQRVALARAFLADAPILILDEATSSLDSITEAMIQGSIERLMRGRTTIVIAHRLSTVRSVDRVLVFDGGRIVEQGKPKEMLARHGGYFRQLYAVQTQALTG